MLHVYSYHMPMAVHNKAVKAWIPAQDDYGLEGCSE